jgi:hypothetical protein
MPETSTASESVAAAVRAPATRVPSEPAVSASPGLSAEHVSAEEPPLVVLRANEPSVGQPQAVEGQRITVREGSVVSADEDHIDPNPAGLALTGPEIRFMQALAPMVTTPRVSTRLVNIYRMIRSTQATGASSRFLDLDTGTGDYKVILILLAIVSGFPGLATPLIEALMDADPELTWSSFVDELLAREPVGKAQVEDWGRMARALDAVRRNAQIPDNLSTYREWVLRVARFSFAAGRVLSV